MRVGLVPVVAGYNRVYRLVFQATADAVVFFLSLHLDEAIHQPVRLSIMATLAHSKKVDFAFLRDQLELGDSNLSRHLTALESLGYIVITKVFEGKRPRTWVSLSSQGREAFYNHVRTLREIVENPPNNHS